MAVSITHAKVSGKAAGNDPDRVYGTHWDADHVVPVATTAEAQAASSDDVLMTPAKTLDLVNANVPYANVVQGVTNDTNITGSIATQNLTLGWTGTLSPARGGTGVANNAASTITISGNFGTTFTVTGATSVTLPTTGTLATLAGSEELTNKTLTSSVGKGTWTTSGTWTLPAVTLGGAITYGGVTLTNAVTGTGKMVLDTSPTIATASLGSSTATTHSARDNSTKLATTAYVDTATREKLTANRTYYVRTDGSNSNTGLTNSSGGAFLTIQKAWDTLVTLDLNGYTVTIKLANTGTFTSGLSATVAPIGGNIIIEGDTSTPANTLVSGAFNCFEIGTVAKVTIQYLKMASSSGYGIMATVPAARVTLGANVDFGACSAAHIRVAASGYLNAVGTSYTISGAAGNHLQTALGGHIEMSFMGTVTLSGTPAFTTFAASNETGQITVYSITYSGSATGARYSATENAIIKTFGGGASFFPGNSAGSTSTGGQYS